MVLACARRRRLAVALLSLGVTACGSSDIEFTLHNIGAASLDSVVVLTTGFSYALGHIAPGERRTVRVSTTGESHIEVEHGVAGRTRLVVDTYFEPGYSGRIAADVRLDSVLRVEAQIR